MTRPNVSFDGMSWPRCGEELHDLEWQLRHGIGSLRRERAFAASVVAAYRALIEKPRRERDRIVAQIRSAP